MPRKQENEVVALSKRFQELFSDPVANYDAIVELVREQQDALIDVRDKAQAALGWLGALQIGLQANLLKSLEQRARERETEKR